jgi:hypothetical protein
MEHYVGLDVSLKQTSICVVNQVGSVVREGVVDSEPEAIAAFVRSKAPARYGSALRQDRRPRGSGASSNNLACRVGSGGWPGLSLYTAPNLSSRKPQPIARASFTQRVVHVDDLIKP